LRRRQLWFLRPIHISKVFVYDHLVKLGIAKLHLTKNMPFELPGAEPSSWADLDAPSISYACAQSIMAVQ
jgi:hypothetical protein